VVARALRQADAFDLGAFFQHDGRALDLQIFDQDHRVTVGQRVAVGIQDGAIAGLGVGGSVIIIGGQRPLESAIRAHKLETVGVGVVQAALRAHGSGVRHKSFVEEGKRALIHNFVALQIQTDGYDDCHIASLDSDQGEIR